MIKFQCKNYRTWVNVQLEFTDYNIKSYTTEFNPEFLLATDKETYFLIKLNFGELVQIHH